MTEVTNTAENGTNITDAASAQNTVDNEAKTPAENATQEQPAQSASTSLTDVEEGEAGTKQTEGENAEGSKPEEEGKAPQGAPEKYEFKAPENVELNSEVVSQFSEIAKELNLTQEAAQKLVDKMAPAINASQAAALAQVSETWKAQAISDPEFGGENYKANLAIAKQGLKQFGSPALVALLNQTRLGEHPEIIRAFYKAGKTISEDTIQVGGSAQNAQNRDPAMVLYGKTTA